MTAVNQLQPIESILTPDESAWFRGNAPHFLDALRMQQTVINQLVIRTGGSGSGSGVADLDALTDRVEALESYAGAEVVSTAANYTTTGNVVVECTDTLTVTLDATPFDGQRAVVFHNAAYGDRVTVSDGSGSDVLLVPETAICYTYYSDLAQWVRG